ncbi:GMC oxidoreductase-like protein 2 [Elsinoe australis]|uniref:GMC oxidoreductase-like protein 2 n=1 Tax=Elsinoe australis TaxID=40998 RepID=A0A4U7B417_9PEZI|nr:GMC oxidoreductase-like protein 2 [Elsinoe australis]
MRFLFSLLPLLGLAAAAPTPSDYEYIIVGSGAGGGPLACRLAMAGKKTLLIEAGDDQVGNVNISVPGYQAQVTQDPKLRWDIFVNHYQDQERAKRDPKFTYESAPFQFHTSVENEPIPAGAKPRGILYPRAGTLGGCVTHNALIWITPHASDWENIRRITGDLSWSSLNLGTKFLNKVYEWLPTGPTDPTILLGDLPFTQHLAAGASVMGVGPPLLDAVTGLAGTLLVDPNSRLNPLRDSTQGFFQIPLIQKNGARTAVREFITDTVSKGYPLTVKTDTHVTKIRFVQENGQPRAVGVDYLEGKYLYRASPLSGGSGTPGSINATKEVIISGGAFNTPQILKLSGIGPAAELRKFNIPVVKDLPGVGTNMQDRYEIPVNVKQQRDFSILKGCTFSSDPVTDPCLVKWQSNPNVLAAKGAYATNGLAATMAINSRFAANRDIDLYNFGGPVNFVGYFPGWGDYALRDKSYFSWYTLKAHSRNRAGTVQLATADPLDTPLINFNYFDTGTTAGGADMADLNAMIQAVNMSRQALKEYSRYSVLGGTPFEEVEPGPDVQSDAQIGQYIKDRSWGHHACCTAPIGADSDPMAVLDGKFRVRGVKGLRVVDASVFPSIPGIFIQAPIMMVSEKAADAILNG